MYTTVSKPASPRKCPVLGSTTALILTCWKWAKVMTNFFLLEERQRVCEKKFEDIWENAWIFRKNYKFLDRRPFLFLEITFALRPWCLALASSIPVLGLKGSLLGRAVLGLGLGIFLCPWPRALCPPLHLCCWDQQQCLVKSELLL